MIDLYGHTFHLEDLVDGYVELVEAIMENGREASPRGQLTRELRAVTLVLDGDADFLPTGTGRKVSPRLAAVEALQVVGGYSDFGALVAVNPHLAEFADQGAFHGAYGPRLRGQIETVVRRLQEDPETRRGVVTLWDPTRDQIDGVKNYPCTTELQFMVRDGALDLHVTMRANDAWHGLAYDGFVFNQLQWTVARMLGLAAGKYLHHAASLHVYADFWDATAGLEYNRGDFGSESFMPHGLPDFERARMIGDGRLVFSADPSEAWYIDKTKVKVPA